MCKRKLLVGLVLGRGLSGLQAAVFSLGPHVALPLCVQRQRTPGCLFLFLIKTPILLNWGPTLRTSFIRRLITS